MSWRPKFQIIGWCAAEDDGEYEGWALSVHWLGFLFEIAFARREA